MKNNRDHLLTNDGTYIPSLKFVQLLEISCFLHKYKQRNTLCFFFHTESWLRSQYAIQHSSSAQNAGSIGVPYTSPYCHNSTENTGLFISLVSEICKRIDHLACTGNNRRNVNKQQRKHFQGSTGLTVCCNSIFCSIHDLQPSLQASLELVAPVCTASGLSRGLAGCYVTLFGVYIMTSILVIRNRIKLSHDEYSCHTQLSDEKLLSFHNFNMMKCILQIIHARRDCTWLIPVKNLVRKPGWLETTSDGSGSIAVVINRST